MGLRIQNNIAALNAHRQLTISDRGLSKSLQRLSSGYRINSASDDAAGLAVSQAFRADIASFRVASRNTTEANALLQVAEGAMDQIGNMLTRLKELATQAASANAAGNLDKLNSEAGKLIAEIDRIAESTEYADMNLIDGTFGVTASSGSTAAVVSASNGYQNATGLAAGETYNIATTVNTTTGAGTMAMTTGSGSETVYFTDPSAGSTTDVYFGSTGLTITVNSDVSSSMDGALLGTASGSSSFQVGAQNQANNRLDISIGNANTDSDGLDISGVSLASASEAQNALDSIDAAISSLNDTRGSLGAYMNRLSYAAANLSTTIENVTAAESVIRDVDMAAEMVTFTKYQILQQAGTAMLAQANLAPQQVLALFGG